MPQPLYRNHWDYGSADLATAIVDIHSPGAVTVLFGFMNLPPVARFRLSSY